VKKKARKTKKKFSDKQYFTLECDPFQAQVGVAINMSGKEFLEVLGTPSPHAKANLEASAEQWDKHMEAGTYKGQMSHIGGGSSLIFLKLDPGNFRESVGILVHELAHAVHELMRQRDTPHTEDTEETYAYMLESLVQKSLKEMYDA
jgi:hypothetical protein